MEQKKLTASYWGGRKKLVGKLLGICEVYLEVVGKASCLQRGKINNKSCWDVGKMQISFKQVG
jgi:hypothetical protein